MDFSDYREWALLEARMFLFQWQGEAPCARIHIGAGKQLHAQSFLALDKQNETSI